MIKSIIECCIAVYPANYRTNYHLHSQDWGWFARCLSLQNGLQCERKKRQFNHLMILPEAGHYGGEVLSDHIAVHVEDLLGQEEKLIMALRVLETLKILARSLSEGRVVSHAILDRRVDPTGLSVEVVVRGGGVVGGGLGPGGDRLHHDEPPTTLWVITALSQDELTSLTTRKHSEIFLRLNCKGNHPGLFILVLFSILFCQQVFSVILLASCISGNISNLD